MLKTNLVRTSFLTHGLLFFVPTLGTIKNIGAEKTNDAASIRRLNGSPRSLDTLIISTDSSGHTVTRYLTEEEKSGAPKVALNKQAMKFTKDYIRREQEALEKILKRSTAYFTMIDTIFAKYGLPLELKYLAIVESDLKTTAVSKVGAKGMWQLMPVTARELGLKVTRKYDERTHAYKSTVAAAKYLRYLYKEFGDWLLALAAYNGGPGTVLKAIKQSGSRNFWALQNYLPAESRGHVKRFIGTHYFFEGTGSITTQTKAEAIAHKKLMTEYLASLTKKTPVVADSTRLAVASTVVK